MKKLDGRIAIVTGARRGIGKAISLAFAQEGARILGVSRSLEGTQEIEDLVRQTGSEAVFISADLGNPAEIEMIPREALRLFGRIDILVNNAGIIHPVLNLIDIDAELWREVLSINLIAPALLTKAVLPTMIENRSGKIINISSIGGRKGSKGRSAYRASKAGLISLTESVAAEVKQYGIDITCVCPSATDTEGYRENIDPAGRDHNPKVSLPQEIAEVVLFLASDTSSAITGTAIDAFGGTNPLFN
jgi:NAD(P)-dependent dehydrogenase (short-subunit alcohol dehydrogenase family)